MNTYSIPYKENKHLLFNVVKPNYVVSGLPSIVIYADESFHTKIPYLFREIAFVKDSSELKFFTDYFLVLKRKISEIDDSARFIYLRSVYFDLINFEYINITKK